MAKTLQLRTSKKKDTEATTSTGKKVKIQLPETSAFTHMMADVPPRKRGRPRKVATVAVPSPVAMKVAPKNGTVVSVGRPKRISNDVLIQADHATGRTPLATQKVLDQLDSMFERCDVQQFRGRKAKPQLILSAMEHQMLCEARELFAAKLVLQRGGQLRRVSHK